MFRRVFLLASLLGTACSSGDAPAGERSGRLVLTRTAPARLTLLDMPALARYCERDSSLSVVAVGASWAGALAMRTVWPLNEETQFAVAATLGGAGSAAVAARPTGDSVQAALTGQTGTITVRPGAALGGRIEAGIPGDSGVATRLIGRFDDLTVRSGACP